MTIEQKAAAYDEAIERAKDFMNGEVHYELKIGENIMCWVFPELRESEDERIRKEIIELVKFYYGSSLERKQTVSKDEMVAWLEKQGQTFTKKDVDDAYLEGVTNTKNEIEKEYEATYQIRKDIATFILNYKGDIKDRAKWMNYLGIKVSFVEKQGEQKATLCDKCKKSQPSHSCQDITALGRCALEKQGEQKPADRVKPKFKVGDRIYLKSEYRMPNDDTPIADTIHEIIAIGDKHYRFEGSFIFIEDQDKFELVEQNPCDKVEPKFHEGEWIVHHGTENIYQVVAVIDNQYQLKYGDNYTIQKCADVDRCARLWYITKDAKDGDVLTWDGTTCVVLFKNIKNSKCFVSYCSANDITFEIGTIHYIEGCHPATKEQRDLLFTKMKEAGYEWYDEKKELKKVEQNTTQETASFDEYEGLTDFERTLADICIDWIGQELGWKQYIKDNADVLLKIAIKKFNSIQDAAFEQKPAETEKGAKGNDREIPFSEQEWSEEDKKKLNRIYMLLTEAADEHAFSTTCRLIGDKECVELQDFLKSLRPRNTWKPSEEQITWLYRAADDASKDSRMKQILNELLSDLKKLRK